jgi:hypothetical protein
MSAATGELSSGYCGRSVEIELNFNVYINIGWGKLYNEELRTVYKIL